MEPQSNTKPYNTSQRLKQIMSMRNLKQVDIVNMAQPYCKKYNIHLGKSTISQYVSGQTEPGQYKLTILGLALGVSEAWLMGYDVPMERNSPTEGKKEPVSNDENELKELMDNIRRLNRDNRAKLIELSRLYLDAQRKNSENQ